MSKTTELPTPDYPGIVSAAVSNIFEQVDASYLSESLTYMFQGFLRSHDSDDRDYRNRVATDYEVLSDFLRILKKCEQESRNELLSNLKTTAKC